MTDFEVAKAFLLKDQDGSNLFDHVADVLLKVISERPENALQVFEQLSASVKAGKLSGGVANEATQAQRELIMAHSKQLSKLYRDPEAPEAVEDDEGDEAKEAPEPEEPLPAPRADVLIDMDKEFAAWRAAGVHMAPQDSFKLQMSLARLAGADDSIQTLRLWGKLLGREGDYFVAEGTGGAAEEGDEDEEGVEPAEPEANKHTYWVCSYPGGPWTRLGSLRPEAVLCARQIKRFLTGNLDASVLGYPAFPGTERAYVRAIIALINEECAIAPKGYFAVSEDGDAVDVAEEFTMPAVADLLDASAWEAYGPAFSSLGRVRPVETEDAEGNTVSQPEGWELQWVRDALAEKWTARAYPRTLPDLKHAHAVLRSEAWPGAFAIASAASGAWSNVYVGYGFARADTLYTPPMPPALQKEYGGAQFKEQDDVIEDPTLGQDNNEEEDA
ncbi:Radial spoke head protein 6-like A [Hondaea fermentalgiana]|uniref:Radial spoke head protein 6-like A n=1 Tax=Hondaea fermentalgiana TaxID=2315210 RepID=A0A2R5GRE2_9STRA|nr:Radial spoke head protein 6-like A [Hondaea fermentalgiana]|eukprot:GBG32879.1 Radial spoke head protein 6-like A [Hondaea fermentalgiana]